MFRRIIPVVAVAVVCAAQSDANEVLQRGARGAAVRAVQSALVANGHSIAVDGIFGPRTQAAVRAFQLSRSLPGTGRVDAGTRRALERPLRRGDRGARVVALQRRLNELGAGISVDGIFGPRTERAVAAARAAGHELESAAPVAATQTTPDRPATGGNVRGAPNDLIAEARRVLASNPRGYRSDVFVVVDFRRPSNQDRFFVVEGNRVTAYFTAHGQGSDPGNTGRPVRFSNTTNSHMSSVGVYRTAETYQGRHGYSLRLDGLSGTNSRARSRAIVIHGASYVSEGSRAGRSWGCFTLDDDVSRAVIDKIKNGALLYCPNPER